MRSRLIFSPSEADQHDDLLNEFVAELEQARSVSEMQAILSRQLAKLGVKHFVYHVARANGLDEVRLPHIITNYPERWRQHYFSSGYLNEDPVVGETLRRRLPFLWSQVIAPDSLSPRQLQLMEEGRDAGIADGLTIPIIGHGADAASLNVVPDLTDAHGRLALVRHRHLLQIMAIHFHRRARSKLLESALIGRPTRRPSLLSAREREILEWIAHGKSTWDIAQILRISEKGVEFHVENLKRKLEVFGRTHAVGKALMLGLIFSE
jgi:LuxR family transcriptional regulator, activator of conjugal transfer of Ti plasmids